VGKLSSCTGSEGSELEPWRSVDY